VQGRGGWNFMSFCSKQDLIDDSLCQQPYTANGAGLAGSQLAVSPSYQTTYASVSFQSPGTWLGVTFRKQFMRALQVVLLPANSPHRVHLCPAIAHLTAHCCWPCSCTPAQHSNSRTLSMVLHKLPTLRRSGPVTCSSPAGTRASRSRRRSSPESPPAGPWDSSLTPPHGQ